MIAYSLTMSRIKSPTEKKRLSLERDRRNVYGECPTSSRKNIKRRKQQGRRELRRVANEELRSLKGAADEATAEATESFTKDRMLLLTRYAFKKLPDAPLGKVLMRKRQRRQNHAKGRKSR